jgi:nucleotide-binding universal stress UspA family protein
LSVAGRESAFPWGEIPAFLAVSSHKDFMNTSRWAAADCRHLPHFERLLCAFDVEQPSPDALGLANLIAERSGASLESMYVASGSPAQAILDRARANRCDLIVLGSRSRSDLGWQFRDDVVRDVSALADCGTLTVHERDTPPTVERILVPIDFRPATSATLERASALALRFQAKVQLLHVVSHESFDAKAQLSALQHGLSSLGVDVQGEVVVASSVAAGIETYNQRAEFDLLVMGSSSSRDPSRLTRGIIATLRNRVSVPLLSVRATPRETTLACARPLTPESAVDPGAGSQLSA